MNDGLLVGVNRLWLIVMLNLCGPPPSVLWFG